MGEWADVTLGDVLTLQRGFDLPTRCREPGPHPVVSSSGVTGVHSEFKVEPPGVVIGRYGSLGAVHWVTERFWPLNTALWVKDFKGNNERFVSYLLKTVTLDGSTASAVPGVNRNHLHTLRVRLPGVTVQRRIAAILSAVDELIETNGRRIEVMEGLVRSLYREWFVHFRFPADSGVEFWDSTLGRIPKGWRIRTLAEVAAINERSLKAADIPDPFDYLDISAVGIGQINAPVTMSAADAPGRARRCVRDGDVVWATVRPNRRGHGLIHDPSPRLVASTGLVVLTPKAVPSSFLFEWASDLPFTEYLASRATGSAYPAVRPSDFGEAALVIPPSEVVELFDSFADPALRATSVLRETNRQLAATRDLLLPRLVTGRLDISDIDLGILTPPESDPEPQPA